MIIKSKCGKYNILIDKKDYDKVIDFAPNGWEIKYTTNSNNPYVITRKTIDKVRKQYYLHRLVMDVLDFPSQYVDHININPLDNRTENLRIVNRSQNMKNRTSKKTSVSKHLGVSYCKSKVGPKKYRAQIKDHIIQKENIHLGYYYDEETAGYAYNIAAIIIHKEYANLNNINLDLVINPNNVNEYVTNALNKLNLNTK